MNNKWKGIVGFSLVMVAVLALPFAWRFFLAYEMMGTTNRWYMPIMHGSSGMMAFGMMSLLGLISLGSLILLGLGIVWLIRELATQKRS